MKSKFTAITRERNRFPLSFSQESLWLTVAIQGGAVYNECFSRQLKGRLKAGILRTCLREIVRRHSILRTRFEQHEGKPVQIIQQTPDLEWVTYDLSRLGAADQARETDRIVREATSRPFDLEEDPLLRAVLIKLEEEEHLLVLILHHIVSDGWSYGILFSELKILYEVFSQGKTSPLPELKIQYGDYAVRQREWLKGEVLEQQLGYWREQLAGLPVLELPTDRMRPAIPTHAGASEEVRIPAEVTRKLRELCRAEGVTLFMVLLTAFQVVLGRWAGQEDVVVGTPVANRNGAELEGLIGFFVNTLVLRVGLHGNPSLRELLGRVREVCLGAYAHQDLPFELLVEELAPKRDLSRNPLFEVTFALQNTPRDESQRMQDLEINDVGLQTNTAMFDLSLTLTERGEALQGALIYSTDLFTPEKARRMVKHVGRVLESIAAHPEQRTADVELMGEEERRQVLVEWNRIEAENYRDCGIHELFEEQVKQCPEAVAVVCNGQKLTYAELNSQANQLARYLRKFGMDAEARVALCLERSNEMIVAILGVLKAGCAYVPLDPEYPKERLRFMLEDASAQVLLTQSHLLGRLPECSVHCVQLDAEWEHIAEESSQNLPPQAGGQNLAYVIYTSGSTGQPKGAMVTHNNIHRLFNVTKKWFCFSPKDVWTLFHSYAFDFSVWELWGPLIHGGRLVIVPYETSRSPEEFEKLLSREKVTVLNQTPSAFYRLIQVEEAGHVQENLSLRWVIFGGEALEVQSLRPWWKRYGDKCPQLVNMYGITETTVHTTYRPLGLKDGQSRGGSVIGRAIPDLQVYVLDKHLQPVPVGVTGELYISGQGLARGYLNRADLTAERFVPNPFKDDQGGDRLYRTGDTVRWLNEGELEYWGRKDEQVKIRGYRIELGEIEAALVGHHAVQKAAVIVHEELPGQKRLVAYTILREGEQLKALNLRHYLQQKLPEYMVPSAWVQLEELPLTENGKLDKQALPAPTSPDSNGGEYVAPRNATEEVLAGIWELVLGIDKASTTANFFELGGDSILAIQIVIRANQAGIHIKPQEIFKYQTIADLAAAASVQEPEQGEQELTAGTVPLTPIQHHFLELNVAEPNYHNQAVLLAVHEPLSLERLVAAVQQLVLHHEALRLRFAKVEGGWLQWIAEQEDASRICEEVDLSMVPEQDRRSMLEQAATVRQGSLDLLEGPLLRMVLFRCGNEQKDRLFIVIHHLAIDGVSWRILLEDLQQLCRDKKEALASSLLPKTTSYKTWAEKLQIYAQQPIVAEEQEYWRGVTAQSCEVPVDGAGENVSSSMRSLSVYLSKEETHVLLKDITTTYGTQINDVLLTALAGAFHAWTGQDGLLVDVEGHGREDILERIDLSRTVGWFTSIYPVRLQSRTGDNLKGHLKQIKEQLRQIPRRGIGYGVLRYLRRDSAEKFTPAVHSQISFNYLGQMDSVLPAGSLFSSVPEFSSTAHGPRNLRSYLIEITGAVMNWQLWVQWSYSSNLHRAETIESVARAFLKTLKNLIASCKEHQEGSYAPSDFPLAELDEQSLQKLVALHKAFEEQH